MTNSVIQDLENEDTTFIKRWSETKHSIEQTQQWVRIVTWKIQEARSTEGSVSFTSGLSTDFFVTIETTKKAISDKRFEEMLSIPPIGWILMGIVKSRKDGTIKAQYVKEDDYPVSETEVINERYREVVRGVFKEVSEMVEEKKLIVDQLASSLSSCRGSRLEDEIKSLLSTRKEIDCLADVQSLFEKLGEDDLVSIDVERTTLGRSNYAWEFSQIFAKVAECQSLSRYIYRHVGIFDPNSNLSQLINWREGDHLVVNHSTSYDFQ